MQDILQDQNILIVGGAGFIGCNLARKLLGFAPRHIVIVDNLLSAERWNIPDDPSVEFIEGSITDDSVLGKLDDRFRFAFHLATFHGNQNSIHDPIADHENNTLTTLKLYEHIRNFKTLHKVVYASAGCTVAEKTFDTAHATAEDAPISLFLDSPYQISKIIGEFYSNYYFTSHGLPVVKARFQNVYGPGEVLGAGKWRGTPATVWRNVVPTFVYKAIQKEALPVEGEGDATRDFIYVDDIVGGLLACAVRGAPGEVYNLASGAETSIHELADLINELAENPAPIDWQPRRSWDHSGKRFGSTEKSRRELGFSAGIGIRKGLTRTIAWTQDNLTLIEGCIQKHASEMDGCK